MMTTYERSVALRHYPTATGSTAPGGKCVRLLKRAAVPTYEFEVALQQFDERPSAVVAGIYRGMERADGLSDSSDDVVDESFAVLESVCVEEHLEAARDIGCLGPTTSTRMSGCVEADDVPRGVGQVFASSGGSGVVPVD